MAKKPLPTPEQLRQLLRYEPETGKLFWRERTPEMFADGKHSAQHICARWNVRYAGREAFTSIDARGYVIGAVFDQPLSGHRVAWAIHHGAWPDGPIDHINGKRNDNRADNLREADIFGNNRNVASAKGSTSRYLGVCWVERRSRWRATIKVNRKQIWLGAFALEEDAARAYDAAAAIHFGPFARLNFPVQSDQVPEAQAHPACGM